MRMRRLPSPERCTAGRRVAADGVGVAVLAVAALLLVAGASGADQPEGTPAGWESLLGDRPSAQLGGRWIVVLAKPSLASRVAAAGGIATEEQERAWTAAARARSARCSRGSRSRARRSSPSTRTTACSTASRRRSMPARSRSPFATPT